MTPRLSPLATLLLAGCLVACQVAPPTGPASTRRPGAAPTLAPNGLATPPAALLPPDGAAIVSRDGAGIVSRDGAGIVSRDGAGITGVATLPAGIVSRDGAGIVSRDGAGIVSRDGAGYRVAALAAEVPLAGRRVYLLTADGKLIQEPGGEPLSAVTDAQGRFAFAGFTTRKNLVLAIGLRGDAGVATAILPRGGAAADVTLASTLAATYIQERFVRPQADPVATLDRLTADLAAAARATVADAVAGAAAQPTDLAAATVVALVDRLRGEAPAVEKAMADVQALLLGQANLGTGLAALDVPLVDPRATAPDGRGGYYLAEGTLGRIRRVTAAGAIETYADRLHGTVPRNFFGTLDLASAPDGTLHVADGKAVWRIRPDGTVEALGAALGAALPMRPNSLDYAPDGTLWVGEAAAPGLLPRVLMIGADGVPREPAPAPEAWRDRGVLGVARTADGACHALVGARDRAGGLYRLPAGGAAWEPVPWAPRIGFRSDLAAAPDGGLLFSQDGGGGIAHRAPDGTLRWLTPDDETTPFPLRYASQLSALPDGRVRVVDRTQRRVLEVGPDLPLTPVAGKPAGANSDAGIVLDGPFGLAFEPAGGGGAGAGMLVTEAASGRIVRWDGARLTDVAGGIPGFAGDGGPASAARLNVPAALAYLGEDLVLLDKANARVRAIAPDGTIRTLVGGGAQASLAPGDAAAPYGLDLATASAIAAGPDGSLYVTLLARHQVLRLAPDGKVRALAGGVRGDAGDGGPAIEARLNTPGALVIGPDGALYVADTGNMRVRRIVDPTGDRPTIEAFAGVAGLGAIVALGEAAQPAAPPRAEAAFALPALLCFDPAGNLYVGEAGTLSLPLLVSLAGDLGDLPLDAFPPVPARIRKIAPDGRVTVVAGPGGRFFPDPAAGDALVLPSAIAVDPTGRLAIADVGANLVRILPAGSY